MGTGAAVVGLLAFCWLAHATVVGLSALGAHPLRGRAGALAILAAALLGAAAKARAAAAAGRGGGISDAGQDAAGVGPELSRGARIAAGALWVAGCAACALGLVLAFALPITAYDALGYRLPVIAQWLDAGRIAWVSSDDPVRNGYPLGQEAISALCAAATGTMRWASATSYPFVIAGALSIAWLADACGVRRALSRAGAALFVLVPIAILNAPSGYVDAAFAGAVVALFCTATLWWLQPARWHALAAGMAAAHVLALKGTGIAFVGVVALTLAAGFAARALATRGTARVRYAEAARLSALALTALLPGAFWIARNVFHTGNPLWPVEIQLAGHTLFRGVASMDTVLSAASNTPAELAPLHELARIAHVWLQLHGPAVDFDQRLSGLGWAFPLLALPALVARLRAFARERSAREGRAFVLLLLMTAGCFALQPLRWWPRYALWLWGAGALAIACQAEALARAGRTRALATGLALLATLSIGEAAFALTHAKGAQLALSRRYLAGRAAEPWDPRSAPNARTWVSPEFWELGLERGDVCRGAWKPATDNANLDGVLAQLQPRPRVHILPDDDVSWPQLRTAWRNSGCARLLLLHGSPVLSSARLDPEVSVAPVDAFDPLFVVGPRRGARVGHVESLQP